MKNISLMLLACLSTPVLALPSYSYQLYVSPPFGKVVINDKQSCTSICLVADQAVNSMITITGIKNHICNYRVNENGSLSKDEAHSYFCTGYTIAAADNVIGEIHLAKHF